MFVVLTRRRLLILLAGAIASRALPVAARDGDGGDSGGHDDGGHDDGGNDSDHDDRGGDDRGGDDGKGDNHGAKHTGGLSQDEVLEARERGRVIPLQTALRIANTRVRGRVIDVDLSIRAGTPQYRVKIRRDDGVIKTVRLNARTGKIIGFLGF